jgi:hypothetical protein
MLAYINIPTLPNLTNYPDQTNPNLFTWLPIVVDVTAGWTLGNILR